ncbi:MULTISPECIES: hypothetical protein [unclassified Luteococcus]|uniref:hypothetical protein n=1 Tax=unclassified Luteococcus TaxID=2639923 RepID=UPI00313B7136
MADITADGILDQLNKTNDEFNDAYGKSLRLIDYDDYIDSHATAIQVWGNSTQTVLEKYADDKLTTNLCDDHTWDFIALIDGEPVKFTYYPEDGRRWQDTYWVAEPIENDDEDKES